MTTSHSNAAPARRIPSSSLRAIGSFVVLASFVAVAHAVTPVARSEAPPRAPSIKDSPGWYYIPDPESASVQLGRRENAPLVSTPFTGGAKSMEELARTALRALHHNDRDSLMALTITEDEFKNIMWLEFPQSRPFTGLTWKDAWISMDQRLKSGVSGALGDYSLENWTLVRVESDSTYQYKNFRVHFHVKLIATGDSGRPTRMTWLRAIAERKGRYKIFSTDD